MAGASNALSASSAVAISGGTLNDSLFANTIRSLSITAAGSAWGLANNTPALLTISGSAGLGGTINVLSSGSQTLGVYELASFGGSESGSYTQGTVPANYGLT